VIKLILFFLLSFINLFANQIDIDFLFEKNSKIMLLIDPNSGKIIKSNKTAQKFYQYTKYELEHMRIQDINMFTPKQVAQEMQRAKSENRNYFIFRHKLKSGETKRVEVHSIPITYDDKKTLFSIIDDISNGQKNQNVIDDYSKNLEEQVDIKTKELVKFQEKLRSFFIIALILQTIVIIYLISTIRKKDKLQKDISDTSKQLQNVLKGSNLGYWRWNLKTKKYDVNKKWLDILGLDQSNITNHESDWVNRVHEDDKIRIMPLIQKAIETGITITVEFRMKHKNGHYVWIEGSGAVIEKDLDGNPLVVYGTHKDITDRKIDEDKIKKLQEDKLKQQQQLLEQAKMASMGEMIGNIAHQWRQPLSVISTGVTGLKLKKELDDLDDQDFKTTCDVINENAQYLSRTIDDFRDFIKGDREKVKFNLSDNLNSFLKLIEPSRKNHDIEIFLDIKDDMDINGYPNELIQCFMNIYNNAKDALDEIEDKRYIFISLEKQNDFIAINFRDNGGGIASKVLPKIFEPYFTTKNKKRGTGLGLHMTYNLIVDGMGGSIVANNANFSYENKEYKGVIVTIKLPQNV